MTEPYADAAGEQAPLRVLVVGQTPPPYGGQAIAIESFLSGSYRCLMLTHVRMGFSSDFSEVGRFSLRKVLHLARLVVRIHRARRRSRATVLYYPPAGPDLVPVLRDLVILLSTRWTFRHTVFHFHAAGLSEIYPRLPVLLRPLFRLAYGRPELALQPSDLNPPDGHFVGARRVEIVPNGVRDEFPGRPPERERGGDPVVLLFAGVLRESKGLLVLVDACRRLHARGEDFRLHLMGEPESAEFDRRLRAAIDEAGLTQKVVLLGVLQGEQKRSAFLASHIFCYPTYFESETFGLVLLEAMQFELPIVATEWRGVPSSVSHGDNGYLVPVRDPAALADKIQFLMSHPEEARAMGERGRKVFLDRFTEQRFQQSMQRCLLSVRGGEDTDAGPSVSC